MLDIVQIPVLIDNYIYLAHCSDSDKTAVVDPALPEPVLDAARDRGWGIDYIINTHHHFDHVGGNAQIKAETGCTIVGPATDADRIPGIDIALGEGDRFDLGGCTAQVFDVPGHTRGHIAYWFADAAALFCGDTLFAMGCGRLFEGTPAQMLSSLAKFDALPDDTHIYCAHEYTEANGRFALSVEPQNSDLQARMRAVRHARAQGQPTIPTQMGLERQTNPFLRADSPDLRATLDMADAATVDVFAKTRALKDVF